MHCDHMADGCDRTIEMMVLRKLCELMVHFTGQDELLQRTLRLLETNLGLVRGTILLVDCDHERLIVGAAHGMNEPAQLSAVYHRGEGIVGKVLTTGEPVVLNRIADEPEFQSRIFQRSPEWRKTLGFVCVPIRLASETIGVLSVDDPGLREVSHLNELKDFLGIVARLIAHDVQYRCQLKQEREALERENARLRSVVSMQAQQRKMAGNSDAIRHVQMRVQQVAPTQATVLIRGESGTGKELVASAIHYNSTRACKPFVRINCAALNENLFESELFGHEKGAFTGAVARRIGRIEEAQGGTVFLDEIGEISAAMQAKLLRVLQECEFERVGGNETIKADVRVIAATNRNLEEAMRNGTFRADLYYRINVFPIPIPPLRDRPGDIPVLANHFVQKYANLMTKTRPPIAGETMRELVRYAWPGNVRELENCIEYAVLLCSGSLLLPEHLPQSVRANQPACSPGDNDTTLKSRIHQMESAVLLDALKKKNGNVCAVAREIGITSRMVRYKLKKFRIDPRRFSKKAAAQLTPQSFAKHESRTT
ncbi:MAG TPA: sigma 54-interacting transcriptional regulator [Kiritimatiellia bacterium]|nr:sigma 54-interacting transcriptional regulator [Kiritimatiellia bacterium]HPS08055.1 sigma 54-interacting transcriptional regulator [Kiritimatiellia bacterium]